MNILVQRPLFVLAAGLACLAILAGTAARADAAERAIETAALLAD